MRCEAVAERLPAAVDEPGALDAEQAEHVEQCLRCQAELAQYRRLRRTMARHGHRVGPRAGRSHRRARGLDDALARRARQRTVGKRAAYLGGLAAATAAGVGGVLVLTTRRRPA